MILEAGGYCAGKTSLKSILRGVLPSVQELTHWEVCLTLAVSPLSSGLQLSLRAEAGPTLEGLS